MKHVQIKLVGLSDAKGIVFLVVNGCEEACNLFGSRWAALHAALTKLEVNFAPLALCCTLLAHTWTHANLVSRRWTCFYPSNRHGPVGLPIVGEDIFVTA